MSFSKSKGETTIKNILLAKNVSFIQQYCFDNCRNKRPLPFDFYLPNYNLCIEFDGEQHYKPKFGMKNFIQTQKHDKIKDEYCKSHNIGLLRIPYWESNNSEQIIKYKLNTN